MQNFFYLPLFVLLLAFGACAKKETPNLPDTKDPDKETPSIKDSTVLTQRDIQITILDSLSFKYGARTYRAGDTLFGHKKYVYMIVGHPTSPLIISSPHDGNRNGSPEIPDRVTTDTKVRDLNVTALGTEISKSFRTQSGKLPFMVVNTIWRKKVEPNRAPNETDHSHVDAIETYNSYHRLLTMAKMIVSYHSKKGLLADIHGHGLEVPRIHVGYRIPKDGFYRTGDLSQFSTSSTIKSISATSTLPFDSLVRGSKSLGGLLVNQGLRAYPSHIDQVPSGISDKFTTTGQTYFNGAYIIDHHGSKNEGTISAVQMEFYKDGIRDTASNRSASGKKIASALYQFMTENGLIK